MYIECIWDGQNLLGESPVWDHRNQTLAWLDTHKKQLHQLNPITKEYNYWDLPDHSGSFALYQHDCFILAMAMGFYLFNPIKQELRLLANAFTENEYLLFNDGKCDRSGRFWAGTMTNHQAKQNQSSINNKLFSIDDELTIVTKEQGIKLSNGIGWSPDNQFMYYIDTLTSTIYRYDYDLQTGTISNRQDWVTIDKEQGAPDGLTVDAQSYVWCAHWGGWRVTCFKPNGEVDRVIKLPVQNLTSCNFGGANFNILYITSASAGLTEQQLDQQPMAGGVFAIDLSNEKTIYGIPEPTFCYTP